PLPSAWVSSGAAACPPAARVTGRFSRELCTFAGRNQLDGRSLTEAPLCCPWPSEALRWPWRSSQRAGNGRAAHPPHLSLTDSRVGPYVARCTVRDDNSSDVPFGF